MTTNTPAPAAEAVLLRESQVLTMIGVASRTLRGWVSSGYFPKPVRMGRDEQRAPKRWLRAEVLAWIDRLAGER